LRLRRGGIEIPGYPLSTPIAGGIKPAELKLTELAGLSAVNRTIMLTMTIA
jgi:hypothetical protein